MIYIYIYICEGLNEGKVYTFKISYKLLDLIKLIYSCTCKKKYLNTIELDFLSKIRSLMNKLSLRIKLLLEDKPVRPIITRFSIS